MLDHRDDGSRSFLSLSPPDTSPLPPRLGVEEVLQAGLDQVATEQGQHNGGAREDRIGWCKAQEGLRFLPHVGPARMRVSSQPYPESISRRRFDRGRAPPHYVPIPILGEGTPHVSRKRYL